MTELADGVVYSRSGLTYQAGLLEKAGLIARDPSPDDDRATLVTITGLGGGMGDDTAVATVTDAPIAAGRHNFNATEGSAFSNRQIAAFTEART